MEESLQYIRDNRDLIRAKNYQDFFNQCDSDLVSEVTAKLVEANIPFLSYMTKIVPFMFADDCSIPEGFKIPANISEISDYAFTNNANLTRLTLPNTVKAIGDGVFMDCGNLEELKLSDNLTIIPSNLISNTDSLTHISIPASVQELEEGCFSTTYFTTVEFKGNKIKSISDGAFFDTELITITIPEGVETIDITAFANCRRLISVHFPSTIKWIARTAFANCNSLEKVYYNGTKEEWENNIKCFSPEINEAEVKFLK